MALTSEQKGTLYVFMAALLFSLGGLGIKLIPWHPLAINGARNLVATAVIFAYVRGSRHRLVVNRAVLIGAACMCLTTTLYVVANKLTTAANAIVLQFTAPVFLIFIMGSFFKQRPTRDDVVTCGVVLVGIAFFFVDGLQAGGMLGNLLALVSGATYAGVFLINALEGSDPISSVLIAQVVSGLVGLPFLLRELPTAPGPTAAAVALGVFQLGLAYIFFTRGLMHTSPVTASLTTGVEPILNPVLVALFYKETITLTALAGALIVVGAIVAYNINKARKAPVQESAPATEMEEAR
ncbi:MAG: EamA family transporter [Clostridiales bacterium]|nr:EamA family transporter [Clostridiales bacterium]